MKYCLKYCLKYCMNYCLKYCFKYCLKILYEILYEILFAILFEILHEILIHVCSISGVYVQEAAVAAPWRRQGYLGGATLRKGEIPKKWISLIFSFHFWRHSLEIRIMDIGAT